jgi:hypothetical protein
MFRGKRIQWVAPRVARHNLPIDRKYTLVGFDYAGTFEDGGGATCENCGRLIVNIATLKDNEGHSYIVGLDCAETLQLTDSDDFWKLKEREALHRKVVKFIKDIKNEIAQGKEITAKLYTSRAIIYINGHISYNLNADIFNQYLKHIKEIKTTMGGDQS